MTKRDLVPPAVLVAFAAVLWVSGRHTAAVLELLAAVALLHALLLSSRFRAILAAFAARVGSVVAVVLTVVFLLPIFVFIITPLGLVMRAVGARPLDLSWQRGRLSYWTERSAGTDPRPANMFTEQRGWHPLGWSRVDRRRVIAGAVVATLLVEALSIGGWTLYDSRRTAPPSFGGVSTPGAAQSAALRGLPWVPQALKETGEVASSIVATAYTNASVRDHTGQYVNVHNRVRASYESPLARTGDPIDIWFFGGSTMFGFDLQRDDHTIPSEIVRLAEADGIPVRARNFGAPGYVNYQETVLLSLVATAEPPPDLVVFYDGLNDVSVQLLAAIAGFGTRGEPDVLGAAQRRIQLAVDPVTPGVTADPPAPLAGTRSDDAFPLTVDSLVADVVDVYGQGIALSKALATQYGFPVVHFWQPDIYSRHPLDPGETDLFGFLGLDSVGYDTMAGFEARVRAALPSGVFDVSDALDHVQGPVFSDEIHVNEVGARAVAEEMYADLLPTLRRLQLPSQ